MQQLKNRIFNPIITAIFLFISTSTFAQWQIASVNPFIAGGYDVEFPDVSAAYVTTGQGMIYKSIDAGATWSINHDFGPFSNIHSPTFMNADTGFVSVNNGVYRTFDGGTNWNPISNIWGQTIGLSLYNVKITDQTLFASYVRNDTTYIAKSFDFGDNFIAIYSNYELNAQPYLFSFLDTLSGHFINPNQKQQVYKTLDGCITVDTLFITTGPLDLEAKFDFIDDNRGFLYGDHGSQSNPSRTWNTGTFYFPIDLDGVGVLPVYDLDFNTTKLYASSAYGKIFVSKTKGSSWVEQITPVNSGVNAIAFANENQGIAVTNYEVLTTNNGGFLHVDELDPSTAIKLFPNPVNDILQISLVESAIVSEMLLIDAQGRTVKAFEATDKNLHVGDLKAGVYFLRVTTEKGSVVKKVIKQ